MLVKIFCQFALTLNKIKKYSHPKQDREKQAITAYSWLLMYSTSNFSSFLYNFYAENHFLFLFNIQDKEMYMPIDLFCLEIKVMNESHI